MIAAVPAQEHSQNRPTFAAPQRHPTVDGVPSTSWTSGQRKSVEIRTRESFKLKHTSTVHAFIVVHELALVAERA